MNEDLKRIVNYLNINYSKHQIPIKERLETINALINDLNSLDNVTPLFLCVYLSHKYFDDYMIHLNIEIDLDELNLDYYIPFKYYSIDKLENNSIITLWLYLPELLEYIPERLEENGGWFKSNNERLKILHEIRNKLTCSP